MGRNNSSSSITEETIESILRTIKSLDAGIRGERAMKAMASTGKGYLCIDGKSLLDIFGAYSEEDLDSLSKHIKEKRPQLARLLKDGESVGAELWETGVLNDGFDVAAFNVRAQEALAADQAEAAIDNCIWASMNWEWQTSENV